MRSHVKLLVQLFRTSVLCECANPYCVTFDMSADDLTRLHSRIGYFVVAAGHDIPDLEAVVQRVDGHAIMKKRTVD
jgi:hypothetical protein